LPTAIQTPAPTRLLARDYAQTFGAAGSGPPHGFEVG
jgi:hypothetical protein